MRGGAAITRGSLAAAAIRWERMVHASRANQRGTAMPMQHNNGRDCRDIQDWGRRDEGRHYGTYEDRGDRMFDRDDRGEYWMNRDDRHERGSSHERDWSRGPWDRDRDQIN